MNTEKRIEQLKSEAELIKAREKKNEEIIDAKNVASLLKEKSFEIFTNKIKQEIEKFKYQDILGLNSENLETQKGIVVGLESALSIIDDLLFLSKQPLVDPETGEVIRKTGVEK